MATAQILFFKNDTLIELLGLKNEVTQVVINSATVDVTLVDDTDAEVVGETWPLSMPSTGADGDYRATLKDTLTLTQDRQYVAKIDADAGAQLKGHWELPLTVKLRKFT